MLLSTDLFYSFEANPRGASGVLHTVSSTCTASFSPTKENTFKQLPFAVLLCRMMAVPRKGQAYRTSREGSQARAEQSAVMS